MNRYSSRRLVGPFSLTVLALFPSINRCLHGVSAHNIIITIITSNGCIRVWCLVAGVCCLLRWCRVLVAGWISRLTVRMRNNWIAKTAAQEGKQKKLDLSSLTDTGKHHIVGRRTDRREMLTLSVTRDRILPHSGKCFVKRKCTIMMANYM